MRGTRCRTLGGDKEAENCSILSGAVPTSISSPPSRYMPPHAVRSDELADLGGGEQRPPQDGRPGEEAEAGKATSRASGLVRASVVVIPPWPSGTMDPPAMWSGTSSVTPACSCQQRLDHVVALHASSYMSSTPGRTPTCTKTPVQHRPESPQTESVKMSRLLWTLPRVAEPGGTHGDMWRMPFPEAMLEKTILSRPKASC